MRSRTASLLRFVLGAAFAGLFLCHTADAQFIFANVTVDENGNGIGTVGRGFLAPDPGPGGLPAVLTYSLPFAAVQGDIFLTDADTGGAILDVIRFNGNGSLVFYSDAPPFDALGDTVSAPRGFYTNSRSIPEVGPEGNNGAFYTPLDGEPGYEEFDTFGVQGFTYHFVSDSTIPEPSSMALFSLGLAVLVLWAGQRRRTRVRA